MATLDTEAIDTMATELVLEYLDDGIEFLTVAEVTPEYEEDADEDDFRAIHNKTREILNALYESL
jgi:hypothetical protein